MFNRTKIMKKVLILLLTIFSLQIGFSQEEQKAPDVDNSGNEPGWFAIGNGHCIGWGICNGSIKEKGETDIFLLNNNRIRFSFLISSLSEENQEFFNGKEQWEQPEQNLPINICNALKLSEKTLLIKNVYPIEYIDGRMNVTLEYK
jgi:hypothetical protein